MTNNYLTNIETMTATQVVFLPTFSLGRTFTPSNEEEKKKIQEKVNAEQQIVMLPAEHGIEEYRKRHLKIASLCKYVGFTDLENDSYRIDFYCIGLCLVKDLKTSSSGDSADVELLPEQSINLGDPEVKKLLETVQEQFREYLKADVSVPSGVVEIVENPTSLDKFIYGVVRGAAIDTTAQRRLLYERNPLTRLKILSTGLATRILEQELEKGQDPLTYYKEKLNNLVVDTEVKKRIYVEINRLKVTKESSSEYGNIIDWLDRVFAFPWNVESEDNKDLDNAKNILNASHFGLEKIKQRVLDIIAIQKYTKRQPPQILCLYGPPGVGKSTIAKSIAEALNRDYYAVSLGGISKSDDIAGEKQYYIGAKPGKIIYGITQAGSKNCVLLLDEIDKMGANQNHGDPSSVLLEVLDRNQNVTFKDNYFDVPMDLSSVFFIATANDLSKIPEPLLNRLDVLTLDGYSLNEKVQITNNYLIKKVTEEFGLEKDIISMSPNTIEAIIEEYTFESGVRQLENIIREICRKHIAYKASSGSSLDPVQLSIEDINKMIEDAYEEEPNLAQEDEIGVVNKLSVVNDNLGSVSRLEVVITDIGKGEQIVSDNIVGTALSTFKTVAGLLRYHANEWRIPKEMFSAHDIYIHSPIHEKKHDGSSGGVADVVCILSAIKNVPVPYKTAFTGAITLKGRVMGIGGVKAKVLAAQRHKMETVVLPLANKKDVDELPPDIVGSMEFKYFEDMTDVYDYVFANS
jgi:ATP-dependent Lon protease